MDGLPLSWPDNTVVVSSKIFTMRSRCGDAAEIYNHASEFSLHIFFRLSLWDENGNKEVI